MLLDKRDQMIAELVENMDYWDQDEVYKWAKQQYQDILDELLPSQLEEEYMKRLLR